MSHGKFPAPRYNTENLCWMQTILLMWDLLKLDFTKKNFYCNVKDLKAASDLLTVHYDGQCPWCSFSPNPPVIFFTARPERWTCWFHSLEHIIRISKWNIHKVAASWCHWPPSRCLVEGRFENSTSSIAHSGCLWGHWGWLKPSDHAKTYKIVLTRVVL